MILGELNSQVANLWISIKNNPKAVSDFFDAVCSTHSKESFLEQRSYLKELPKVAELLEVNAEGLAGEAGRFLYLNKNCYNGSIRFNRAGNFNAPMGKYDKVQTYDKENALKVSKALKRVKIYNRDFQRLFEDMQLKGANRNWEKTLFYFDPPYIPLSTTSHFTYYTADGFRMYDQKRLRFIIDMITSLGGKVIASNSCSPVSKELYKIYNQKEIHAARSINVKADKRGKIKELLIKNF